MAFSFAKTKGQARLPNSLTSSNGNSVPSSNNGSISPNKLTNTQLNKSAKLMQPTWLKDSAYSSLKQLPAIYHGVLGQVQLQPALTMTDSNKFTTGLEKLVKQHQKTDYLNRFTDTERVYQLLSTSRLPNEHLAAIWAHVNKTFPGQLTNREVCLALALIAIFQRLNKDGLLNEQGRPTDPKQDPFVLVKQEKKAPVPTLYPNDSNHKSSENVCSRIQASSSVPNDLDALLIDITDDANSNIVLKSSGKPVSFREQSLSLLDGNNENGLNLDKLQDVWLRYMSAMRALFKRTFNILNVESSRMSALEALKSDKGVTFCKNLCLCYPIAHNVSSKIDELKRFQERLQTGDDDDHDHDHDHDHGKMLQQKQFQLIDKIFITQINDLMISINEYWAVLINLFHECGLTGFIELIMDGLNRQEPTIESGTLADLLQELDTANKPDLCSLCHTRFYLVNIDTALDSVTAIYMKEDLDLLLSNELLSDDPNGAQQYFYHVRCANFWLNNVSDDHAGQLPFRASLAPDDGSILKPTSTIVQ